MRDGFSYERIGRTVMWNDFVIVGPANDPAGVLRRARTDAVGALEAIAAAGAAGRANFVSRGDKSGTNSKELEIWGLSRVARNAGNEPAAGSGNPAWYHKAGLGMADTLAPHPAVPVPRRRLLHDHRPRHAAATRPTTVRSRGCGR